jgi:hypothetical protein
LLDRTGAGVYPRETACPNPLFTRPVEGLWPVSAHAPLPRGIGTDTGLSGPLPGPFPSREGRSCPVILACGVIRRRIEGSGTGVPEKRKMLTCLGFTRTCSGIYENLLWDLREPALGFTRTCSGIYENLHGPSFRSERGILPSVRESPSLGVRFLAPLGMTRRNKSPCVSPAVMGNAFSRLFRKRRSEFPSGALRKNKGSRKSNGRRGERGGRCEWGRVMKPG